MLTESVTVRVIWGSKRLFNAIHFAKCFDDVGVKAPALIAMDP